MTRPYPHIVTPPPGPLARAIVDRDREYTSHCYIKEYPLAIARGAGVMVEDVDGNRYLDFMAGIAVASTGYGHPKVVKAVQDAAANFLHICGSDFYYEGMAALCEKLARVAPGPTRKRVFLTNSGTEATEGAIKLARFSTRRTAIIAFKGAFHGRSTGAVSLTSSKVRQHAGFGPLLPDVHHVDYAYRYRCRHCAHRQQCHLACVSSIEHDLFQRHLSPRDVAAIFVEPVQGMIRRRGPRGGWLTTIALASPPRMAGIPNASCATARSRPCCPPPRGAIPPDASAYRPRCRTVAPHTQPPGVSTPLTGSRPPNSQL